MSTNISLGKKQKQNPANCRRPFHFGRVKLAKANPIVFEPKVKSKSGYSGAQLGARRVQPAKFGFVLCQGRKAKCNLPQETKVLGVYDWPRAPN